MRRSIPLSDTGWYRSTATSPCGVDAPRRASAHDGRASGGPPVTTARCTRLVCAGLSVLERAGPAPSARIPHGRTGQQRDRVQFRVLAVERMACLLGAVGPTCCTTKPVLVSATRTQTFRLP